MKRHLVLIIILGMTTWLGAQLPPPCPSNAFPPADLCSDACIYCNFNGLSSSTAGYTSQTPPGFCGTVENEQWLGFIAGASSATFIAATTNCSNGDGIQIALYEACSSTPLACYGGCGGCQGTPASITSGMVIGQNYFLMIDGFAGDQCSFNISVNPPQSIAAPPIGGGGAIQGPTEICPGAENVVYTIPPISGAAVYTWNAPAGSTINGQSPPVEINATDGGNQVTVTFGSQGGQICVRVANSCYTGALICKNITLDNCCNVPATITGTNCFTGSTTKLTANPTGGYVYAWSTSQTARTITVPPGTYCVTITQISTGCTGTACVTVCNKPIVAITPVATVTNCNGECILLKARAGNTATYQWSNSGPATATWSVCPTAASTVYTVTATNHSGCTATKSVTVKTVICNNTSGCAAPWNLTEPISDDEYVEESPDDVVAAERNDSNEETTQISGDGLVRAYPNPASQELMLDYAEQVTEIESLALFDLNGRKMLDVGVSDTGYSRLDVSMLPTGLYFLKINGAMTMRVALAR